MTKFSDRKKVYVLGGAQTDFARNWSKEGKGIIALLKEVIDDGFNNVGLTYDEVSLLNVENKVACFVGNFLAEKYIDQGHLGALLTEVNPCFYGVPSARYEAACASGSVAIDAAMTKIQNGDIDVAIVVGWELMKTVDSDVCGDYLGRAAYYDKEGKGIPFPFPTLFGKLADELLLKYRYDENRFMNSLSIISNQNYANAKKNPNAQTRLWFNSIDEANQRGTQTNSFVGGGRLAATDCSQVTDGAAVAILASEEYIQSKQLGNKPYIKGYGHRVAPMLFEKKMKEAAASIYMLPWTRKAVEDAYMRSGLSVDDIDVFETHDCFTSSEFAAISAFGIIEPGNEIDVIENGDISISGQYPINPSGGLIGCGHPVGASGVRMMLDCYKQVANQAFGYQIANASNAVMLNIGGTATTNYVFIVGR